MDEPEQRRKIDRHIALDARDWIVRLTSGNVSDADLQRFKAWQERSPEHRRAFERERMFWQQLQVLDGKSDGMPPFHLPKPARQMPLSRRRFLIGGTAAAAAAASIVAAPRIGLWWHADYATGIGEQAEITLPDGSVAMLNTDSAIAVNFSPEMRLVTLMKGEAGFQVGTVSDTLFRVAALGGNSDALGTLFSVRAIDGRATITVMDGRVRVAGPAAASDPDHVGAGSVELEASEQTSYAAGMRPEPAMRVDTDVEMAWRNGRVIFEGRPFGSAVAELGRYLSERIVMAPGVDPDIPVSAIFSTRDALSAVRALAGTQGRTARRIPGLMIVIA